MANVLRQGLYPESRKLHMAECLKDSVSLGLPALLNYFPLKGRFLGAVFPHHVIIN